MNRVLLAELIVVAIALLFVVAAIFHIRYRRYEARWARGHRHDKPVWKPFWFN